MTARDATGANSYSLCSHLTLGSRQQVPGQDVTSDIARCAIQSTCIIGLARIGVASVLLENLVAVLASSTIDIRLAFMPRISALSIAAVHVRSARTSSQEDIVGSRLHGLARQVGQEWKSNCNREGSDRINQLSRAMVYLTLLVPRWLAHEFCGFTWESRVVQRRRSSQHRHSA